MDFRNSGDNRRLDPELLFLDTSETGNFLIIGTLRIEKNRTTADSFIDFPLKTQLLKALIWIMKATRGFSQLRGQ